MPNNITETTITGKKFRVWDSVNNIWKRISYWTKASDVEMNDGSTLEQKISDIEDEIDERTEDAVFDSYQDYLDAYNQGEVPVGTVVYIKDDNNGTVTALQVSYGSTNVGAVLDTLGTPSQASGVTGNTAFAKINTLNSDIVNHHCERVIKTLGSLSSFTVTCGFKPRKVTCYGASELVTISSIGIGNVDKSAICSFIMNNGSHGSSQGNQGVVGELYYDSNNYRVLRINSITDTSITFAVSGNGFGADSRTAIWDLYIE